VETDELSVAVVMQRKPLKSRWQPFQWLPAEVVLPPLPAGAARCLRDDPSEALWLYPGLALRLYSDEAEGYFLNLDSGAPCWFIMWRMNDADLAVPQVVTLSYNEAARMMDGGEQVDTLPAPPYIVRQMESFVQEFYRPEPKRKRRKPSFEGGAAVQEMAEQEVMRRGR